MGTTQKREDELWKRKKQAVVDWYTDLAALENYSCTDRDATNLLELLDAERRQYFIEKNGRKEKD